MMSEQNVKQSKSGSEVQNNKTGAAIFYTQKKGRCTANDRKTEEIRRILRSVR